MRNILQHNRIAEATYFTSKVEYSICAYSPDREPWRHSTPRATPIGSFVTDQTAGPRPRSIAVAPDGSLYIADRMRTKRRTARLRAKCLATVHDTDDHMAWHVWLNDIMRLLVRISNRVDADDEDV